MTNEQKDIIRDHGPYTLGEDGALIDCNGVALAHLVPDGGEECEWDLAVVAALNETLDARLTEAQAFDFEDRGGVPSVFIQWKGSDVCCDVHCACGAHLHIDADFMYNVLCQHCGTKWELPSVLPLRKAKETEVCIQGEDNDGACVRMLGNAMAEVVVAANAIGQRNRETSVPPALLAALDAALDKLRAATHPESD